MLLKHYICDIISIKNVLFLFSLHILYTSLNRRAFLRQGFVDQATIMRGGKLRLPVYTIQSLIILRFDIWIGVESCVYMSDTARCVECIRLTTMYPYSKIPQKHCLQLYHVSKLHQVSALSLQKNVEIDCC